VRKYVKASVTHHDCSCAQTCSRAGLRWHLQIAEAAETCSRPGLRGNPGVNPESCSRAGVRECLGVDTETCNRAGVRANLGVNPETCAREYVNMSISEDIQRRAAVPEYVEASDT
jgi:hypothetical protein